MTFGAAGFDDVPISKAIQASSALPGLFPPVAIDGHHYVDGALNKTLHASAALDQGVRLLLCVNPLVSFDAHSTSEPPTVRQAAHDLERTLDGLERWMIAARAQAPLPG